MSTVLPFSNNIIQVYAYEGFSYTLSNPDSGTYTLQTVSNSSGFGSNPSPLYFTKNGNTSYTFAVTDLSNNLTAGTQESFLLTTTGAIIRPVSSNIVNIGAGRFLDGSGATLSNTSYTFYKQEPIPRIRFVAPSFTLNQPTSVPALPPGLAFVNVASNMWDLSGIPLTTVPTSNYQIIGVQTGGSKIITTRINMTVSNERIRINVSGSPVINMTVGSAIQARVLTSIPPSGSSVVRYTYPSFPDGITVKDICGTTQTGTTFTPTDPSYTMIISGTPSLTAAYAFRDAGVTSTGLVYPVQATRTVPLPLVSNSQSLVLAFGETVLFDQSQSPTLYTDARVDSSAVFYRAGTYFGGTVGMSNIFSPDLRSDLSLVFIPSLSRANLSGTPLSAGSASYTIRAINSNGTQRDYSTPISVVNDAITFTSPIGVDLCSTFVLSRPVSQSLSGYYISNIQFTAIADSRRSVVLSAPALNGTGLSLNSNGVLSGTPTTITPLTNLIVTATVSGSPSVTASKTIKFSIVDDQFTFGPISSTATTLLQNKAMTPIQVTATTLSGRNISSFSATGLPSGVSISSVGIISGTPLSSGVFAVIISASTGFSSGSTNVTLNVIPDNIIVALANTSDTVATSFSGVEFDVLTYSGNTGTVATTPISNRAPQQGRNFSVSFPSSNLLQGDFTPLPALLPRYRFAVTGSAGTLTVQSTVNVAVTNPSTFVRHLIGYSNAPTGIQNPTPPNFNNGAPPYGTVDILRNTGIPVDLANPGILNDFTYTAFGLTWTSIQSASNFPSNVKSAMSNIPFGLFDMAQSGSTLVAVLGSNLIRSIDSGATWSLVSSSNIQSLAGISGGPVIPWPPPANPSNYTPSNPLFSCIATDGTSNWLAIGNGSKGASEFNVVRRSFDNGETWVDTSINQILVGNSNTKLFYSGGRYILLPGGSNSTFSNLYYADASSPSSWTGVSIAGYMNGLASNGSGSLLVVGSNGASAACYSSSTNGTSWSALGTDPIPYSAAAAISNAHYAHGSWVVVGRDSNGFAGVSRSTDLSGWSVAGPFSPGAIDVVTEDGAAWQLAGTGVAINGRWSNSAIVWAGGNPDGVLYNRKRILASTSLPGTPSLTLTLPFDSNGIAFVEPAILPTILWQHVPLSPSISVRAQTSTPNQFLYYYASGLPDGLRFVTNDICGTSASITGTSVRYSDAPQRVLLFAVDDTTNPDRIATLRLNLRTILPTVTRQQIGAGAYTSLVRQYTLVNAAQNARDNRVFPNQEALLGEFTAPPAPDVVTQPIDPRCFDPNACQ